MKNVKLTFALMAALAIGFASCEKDDDDDKPKDDGGSSFSYEGRWESTSEDDYFVLEAGGTGTYNVGNVKGDITDWGKGEIWDLMLGEMVDGFIIEYGGIEDDYNIKGDTLIKADNIFNKFVKVEDDGSGDDGSTMADITGISVMTSRTGTSVSFSLVDDAYGYFLFVNGTKDSSDDLLSTGSPIKPETTLSEGDEITIKGYSDMDATDQIAEGSYTIQAADL